MIYFYTSTGAPFCFSPDDETLYFWNGKPAAYVRGGAVYSFKGRLLGWWEPGWLFDRANRPAFFSEGAGGGPPLPSPKWGPKAQQPQQPPQPAMPEMGPMRPMKTRTWSPLSGAGYFSQ